MLGGLVDLVDVLTDVREKLRGAMSVEDWSRRFHEMVKECCELPAAEAWRWQQFETVIAEFVRSAQLDGDPLTDAIDHEDLSQLMRARLQAGPGRPRFGTGSVTVSSFMAQRGVPYEVVCILGGDGEPGGAWSVDDLVALNPCIGDRDQRSEYRAQLLDAVLSARRALVILSNGRDVRTNREIPPMVAMSELLEVIDRTVRTDTNRSASEVLTIDHPRQAWADAAFVPDGIVPDEVWSWDRAALAAATIRRERTMGTPGVTSVEPEPSVGRDESHDGDDRQADDGAPIDLTRLARGVAAPTVHRIEDRLGIALGQDEKATSDLIDLTLDGLQEWSVGNPLLQQSRRSGEPPTPDEVAQWIAHARAEGSVPPGILADTVLRTIVGRVGGIMACFAAELDEDPQPRTVAARVEFEDVDGEVRAVEGNVTDVIGSRVLRPTLSRLKCGDLLRAVIDVAVLTLHDPSVEWESVLIGRPQKDEGVYRQRVRLRTTEVGTGAQCAQAVLRRMFELLDRAADRPVPFFAETSTQLWLEMKARRDGGEEKKGGKKPDPKRKWDDSHNRRGERYEPANRLFFDLDWWELTKLTTEVGEVPGVSAGTPALAAWAKFVWEELERVAVFETAPVPVDTIAITDDAGQEASP